MSEEAEKKLENRSKTDKSSEKSSKSESLDREIKETLEAGKSAYPEAVGLDESLETTGRVSEILRESSEETSDNDGKTATTKSQKQVQTKAELREKLLQNPPPTPVMIREIRREILKEIGYLSSRLAKSSNTPCQTNNMMKKIRSLNHLLSKLYNASKEYIKTLWLRFVHGIM